MCYAVYLSTTCDADLTAWGNELCRLEKNVFPEDQEILDLLQHPHQWFVTRYGGCSCHFRHLVNHPDLPDFGPPEDWAPEDPDDIESTAAAYDIFKRLVEDGFDLDVVSVWSGCEADEVAKLDVRMADVPRDSFRFIENTMFLVAR